MVDYKLVGKVAVLKMDDGKANAVGHDLIDGLNTALDQAEAEASCVLLSGRDGVFSAGFDLKEFEKGPDATSALVNKGAHLLLRLFTHPQPLVAACAGHAVAAGGFLLLTSDLRIGTKGSFKIGLNETAIGMTLPVFGLELAQARLSKRWLTRSAIQAELFSPEDALAAGFFDHLSDPELLFDTALGHASTLAELPTATYAANKLAIRESHVATIKANL